MDRFPKDPNHAKLWKLNLDLDVGKQIHGMVCIDHFTEGDFEFINRATGKFGLRKNAVPNAIQNMNNVLAPVKTLDILEPTSTDMYCDRCKEKEEKAAATEILLDRSNMEIEKLKEKILELRKSMKGLRDRSYSLEKSNAHLKTTVEEMKIKTVDPRIEKFSKVCAWFQSFCDY